MLLHREAFTQAPRSTGVLLHAAAFTNSSLLMINDHDDDIGDHDDDDGDDNTGVDGHVDHDDGNDRDDADVRYDDDDDHHHHHHDDE